MNTVELIKEISRHIITDIKMKSYALKRGKKKREKSLDDLFTELWETHKKEYLDHIFRNKEVIEKEKETGPFNH